MTIDFRIHPYRTAVILALLGVGAALWWGDRGTIQIACIAAGLVILSPLVYRR